MSNEEIRNWAKEKVKGNIWNLIPAMFITTILTNLQFRNSITVGDEVIKTSYSFGVFFFFVQVGLVYFMINFITDREYKLNDIFSFSKDFGKCFCTGLVRDIFVFLWTLLFIVPGVMKSFGYSLVPMLLTDEKYRDLSATDILKKSEEMMNGHKMDYFLLMFGFIGWILLIPLTFGIILFWLLPWMEVASTKFLYDIKCAYEGVPSNGYQQPMNNVNMNNGMNGQMNNINMNNGMNNDLYNMYNGGQQMGQTMNPNGDKYCPSCGASIQGDAQFCTNCGARM